MKKSKLARKKDNPNSTYWRTKADELITKICTGKPCAICHITHRTCGHHLISRKVGLLRHNLINLIVLCDTHHNFSNDIAPHSSYLPAVVKFGEWLKNNHPQKWDLMMTYKSIKGEQNYENAYNVLLEIINAPDGVNKLLYER
jgi:hypothetical protein